jgi:chromosome segregation ATPase
VQRLSAELRIVRTEGDDQLVRLQDELRGAESERDAYADELEAARREAAELETALTERDAEVRRLSARLDGTDERDDELTRLTQELSSARAERQSLMDRLEAAAEEANGLRALVASREVEVRELSARLHDGGGVPDERLARLEEELAAARAERDEAAGRLESTAHEVEILRAAVTDREAEIDRVRGEAAARIAELSAGANGGHTAVGEAGDSAPPPGAEAASSASGSRSARRARSGTSTGERVVATILIMVPIAIAVLLLTGVLKLSFGS